MPSLTLWRSRCESEDVLTEDTAINVTRLKSLGAIILFGVDAKRAVSVCIYARAALTLLQNTA